MGRPPSQVPPCRFCQKQFRRREHLRRHERIHTNEKPFVCECGERFARQDLLARHMRSSHKDSPGASVAAEDSSLTERDGELRHSSGTQEPSLLSPPPLPADHRDNGFPTPTDLMGNMTERTANQTFPWNEDIDLDFLWNDSFPFSEVLPARFFDPSFSLADISQPHQPPLLENQQSSQKETTEEETNTDGALRTSTAHIPPAPSRSFHPEPQRLLFDSNDNDENPLSATVDETDPSQNRQLKGNFDPSICPWKITPSDYAAFSNKIKKLAPFLPPSFSLPSRHTLSRFLEGYFRGFHDHLPFLHTPSFSILSLGPELILSLAAVGAFYRFEHAKGYTIYHAARMLIHWRLDRRNGQAVSKLTNTSSAHTGSSDIHDRSQKEGENAHAHLATQSQSPLRLLQGLIVLMTLESWGDRAVAGDFLAMSGQVAMLARELGISAPSETHETPSWEQWVEQEEHRRTLWVAHVQFNLQSIAFNVPPMILNQEVLLTLPACGEEWKARNAQEWTHMRSLHTPDSRNFQQALGQLLRSRPIHKPTAISAFANYVLIHGLVQEIFFARNTISLEEPSGSLQMSFVQAMESALQTWQNSWEATYESTLDPLSPRGPLGFNATALLRLAYIRLNANIGPHRRLNTRDPAEIAHGLLDGKTAVYQRSPSLDCTVLQCIHALSIPVRAGIRFIARTKMMNWSMQHSLCYLECAFFLNHWLQELARCIETSGTESIRDEERRLLSIIYGIVREADLTELPDWADDNATAVRRLTACTIRLWAETFTGFYVFEISNVIGESLAIMADILDARLASVT